MSIHLYLFIYLSIELLLLSGSLSALASGLQCEELVLRRAQHNMVGEQESVFRFFLFTEIKYESKILTGRIFVAVSKCLRAALFVFFAQSE